MTTAAPSKPVVLTEKQRALSGLRFARAITANLLKEFPADKVTFQPSPTDNHVLWNLGHLACTYQWMGSLLDGKPKATPEKYDELFGGKGTPVSDPKKYPALAEVRREYERGFDRFIAAFEATKDADLNKPVLGEGYGFVTDRLDAATKATWHEGWHAGQISSIRRALKLPGVIG